jgi:hypothetical protein
MARFNTKMTDKKYESGAWPGKLDWLSLESDIRVVLRDHFAGGSGGVPVPHLDHIDRLLEFYTGRGSENSGG